MVEPGDVRSQLPEHPPTEPESFDAVMADVERIVVPGLTQWQHPGFFAYFPSNTSYPSILGELLSAGLGVQGMSWVTSPACTEVETLMLDWMRELLDLPARFDSRSDNGGGVIQGTASEATLVGDPVGPLARDRRRRQRRRRHDEARCLCHIAGAFERREGSADRRRRHRAHPDRGARRIVRDACRRT